MLLCKFLALRRIPTICGEPVQLAIAEMPLSFDIDIHDISLELTVLVPVLASP